MRDHFMISECDGGLYDTRAADWSKKALRPNYARHHVDINSAADFKATLRAGGFAWPGRYPLYFIMADGEALSFDSARKNVREILQAIADDRRGDGWLPIICAVNYEDPDLRCAHSGELIPAAYSDDSDE